MKSYIFCLFALVSLVRGNPILVEPVNPIAVQDVGSKVFPINPVNAIPLANSVQPVPSSVPVESVVVPVPQASPVSPVAVVEPVVAPAVVKDVVPSVVATPNVVVPSTYSNEPVVAPVVPVKSADVVPSLNVDKSVVVPSVVASSPVAQPVEAPVVAKAVVAQPSAVVPSVEAAKSPVSPSEVAPVAAQAAPVPVDSVPSVDKNAAAFSEQVEKANKLIIDVEEHLKQYLPADDEIATTQSPHIYSGDVAETEAERQQNQLTSLIDQVNRLADSIERTINSLVADRRYVTAAMLRSMLNYVRRVRVNLERLSNRLQSVQSVATSGQSGQNAPASPAGSGVPGATFFNSVRDRINRMTDEIGALVTRIRGTMTPGSNVTVSSSTALPPPLAVQPNLSEIGAIAASGSIANAINTINSVPQNVAAIAPQSSA